MSICSRCGQLQPLAAFRYRRDKAKHDAMCKTCDADAHRSRKWSDEGRAWNRERSRQWLITPAGQAYVRRRTERDRANPETRHRTCVQRRCQYLIRTGVLKRQPCFICGSPRGLAHHPDYSRPAEVVWLCQLHHSEEHRRLASA